jgi:hypothetical protein
MSKIITSKKTRRPIIDISIIENLKEVFQVESQTVLHCNYVSKRKYPHGGWVNIFPTTYLVNNDQVLPLLHAENIPIAPNYHLFNKPSELKQFTLYFPAIPKDWKQFSMVEKCKGDGGFIVKNIQRNNIGVYEVSLY